MAKIDTITVDPNDPENTSSKFINVTATVGANGVNLKEDVMVVQALLKLALEPNPDFRGVEFPEPTGTFNEATAQLIKKYQRNHNRRHTQKVSIDGRIDPARGGHYAFGTKKLWTIFSLNIKALETAILYGYKDPVEEICKRWNSIRGILINNGVGSLGLELE